MQAEKYVRKQEDKKNQTNHSLQKNLKQTIF
jgi:hypothetical protein